MKFNRELLYRLGIGLFLGMTSLFVAALGFAIWQGIAMGIMEWPYLLAPAVFACMPLAVRYQSAPGELTEDGVYVRHCFLRRFYRWSEIRQAGILHRSGKGGGSYDLILVKPGGSPRKPGDNTTLFLLRNLFRLIHIPDEPELVEYVTAHCGPLAYDQSKGVWDE